jgi:hypothetical protein
VDSVIVSAEDGGREMEERRIGLTRRRAVLGECDVVSSYAVTKGKV